MLALDGWDTEVKKKLRNLFLDGPISLASEVALALPNLQVLTGIVMCKFLELSLSLNRTSDLIDWWKESNEWKTTSLLLYIQSKQIKKVTNSVIGGKICYKKKKKNYLLDHVYIN